MENHKDYKLKSGNILRVLPDPDPKSPDIWGNEDIFLVYDHKHFNVKREGFEPRDIFNYYENKEIDDEISGLSPFIDYYIFPVDAYIHSGVHLSLANTANYPDRKWDVSTTGYVLVKKDILQQGAGNIEEDLTEKEAKKYAEGLIETWNQYLSGDIYGFQVLKPIKTYTITEENKEKINEYIPYKMGSANIMTTHNFETLAIENIEYEEIDSCWGFYGEDIKTNGMLEHINDEIIEE